MVRFASTIFAIAMLLVTPPAGAALYRIGTGAGCTHATIQAAVNAAAASVEADELRISQTQNYTQQNILIDQAMGVMELAGGFATCQSNAPTTGARTQLNGGGSLPVIRINNTATVRLYDLDIQGGSTTSSGGGVYVTGSNNAVLVLSDTLVRSNRAFSGGGIALLNTDPDSGNGAMQLLMFGRSAVLSNSAEVGGGIHCSGGRVMMFDQSHVSYNSALEHGGGIFADNCSLVIGSTGVNGAVVLSNNAGGHGGGLYLGGTGSIGDMYTVDPLVPAGIVGNSALRGGGVAVANGAQLYMYNANIELNNASAGGGGALLAGAAGAGSNSVLYMTNMMEGGPAAAVTCADPEACNLVRGNRAIDDGDGERAPGAAVIVDAPSAYSAHAIFRGTRIESNLGTSLSRHIGNFGQVSFNGALIVRNDVSGVLLDAPGTANSLVLLASTVASNLMGTGRGVLKGAGGCDPNDDVRGSYVWRSIVWQPSHPLIEAASTPVPGCFRYLIGNDFAGLPAAADRVVINPLFRDINSADFRLSLGSSAIDFAPAETANVTRDGGPRVFDFDVEANLFGEQDLGAYEYALDRIFSDGFEDGNQ